MNFFAILVVVGFLIWAVLLLDTLVSARSSDTHEVATKCLVREVSLGDHAGVSSIQGRRSHMEDTYQVLPQLPNDPQTAIFAVFDGHGGPRASEYCAQHLHTMISDTLLAEQRSVPSLSSEIIPLRALQTAFRQLDRDWLNLARAHSWEDGSTAVCALVHRGVLYVANVGDSRAVLCTSAPPVSTTTSSNGTPGSLTPLRYMRHLNALNSHNTINGIPGQGSGIGSPQGTATPSTPYGIPSSPSNSTLFSVGATHSPVVRSIEMSSDHKPSRDDERKRVESLGGRIVFHGTWRVEGILALTRAIGDKRLKAFVSGEPEVRRRRLLPGDAALIIASDGLWDVISSEEACTIIQGTQSPQEAADYLTKTAFSRGSADNITTMVINLRPYVGNFMSNTTFIPTMHTGHSTIIQQHSSQSSTTTSSLKNTTSSSTHTASLTSTSSVSVATNSTSTVYSEGRVTGYSSSASFQNATSSIHVTNNGTGVVEKASSHVIEESKNVIDSKQSHDVSSASQDQDETHSDDDTNDASSKNSADQDTLRQRNFKTEL